VLHYEEALYQVYGPLPLPFTFTTTTTATAAATATPPPPPPPAPPPPITTCRFCLFAVVYLRFSVLSSTFTFCSPCSCPLFPRHRVLSPHKGQSLITGDPLLLLQKIICSFEHMSVHAFSCYRPQNCAH